MVMPALLRYSFASKEPVAVNLDLDSLKPDVILVLDTYFNVVIWYNKNYN